MLDVLYDS